MTEKQIIECELPNGDYFKGALEGKPKQKQGYGLYKWTSGDSFEGDWEKDVFYGHGVYKFANGS